jgi:hypothetical protein
MERSFYMERLPYIDEHAMTTGATREQAWTALVETVRRQTAGGERLARLLGCDPAMASPPAAPRDPAAAPRHPAAAAPAAPRAPAAGPPRLERFEGLPGQTVPGFRVAEAEPGRRLVLRGRHRFSDYQLTFLLDDDGRLRAQTHAAFPGVKGRVYKTLVLGSRLHVLATRRILRAAASRAPELPASAVR